MAMKIIEEEVLTIMKEIEINMWDKITTEDKGMIDKEARALVKINIPDLIEIDRNKEGLMMIDTDIQKEWEETNMKEKKRDNEIKKKDVAEADKKALTNTNLIAKTDMNMIHLENKHLAMRDRIQETAEVPHLQEETKTENEDTRDQRIERENTQDLPTEKESIQDPTLLTEFLKREDMPKEHNQQIIRIEMIITKEIQTHM